MKCSVLYIILSVFTLVSICSATIINIPNDQPTIQTGIDIAVDGDTVLVEPGRYVENINYNGKNIVVGSLFLSVGDTSYIAQTVIAGDGNGSVVTFENGEDSTTALIGFTITKGNPAISCKNRSGPFIYYCSITENSALSHFTIGIIECINSYPKIDHCTIANNFEIPGQLGLGYGIHSTGSALEIVNTTISANTNLSGGISSISDSIETNIKNSIIWNNGHNSVAYSISKPQITFSDIQGGFEGIGNIEADPLFCDSDGGNFSIANNSPCVGTGENGKNMGSMDIGCTELSSVSDITSLPYIYNLHQNHPNPFNPVTTIRYELPRFSNVRLAVFDILGREVAVLRDRDQGPGVRKIQWDASDVPSGVYFVQMIAGDFRQVRKVMVLK